MILFFRIKRNFFYSKKAGFIKRKKKQPQITIMINSNKETYVNLWLLASSNRHFEQLLQHLKKCSLCEKEINKK